MLLVICLLSLVGRGDTSPYFIFLFVFVAYFWFIGLDRLKLKSSVRNNAIAIFFPRSIIVYTTILKNNRKNNSTMEELITLRKYIEERDYIKALELVGELEEMSKEDKLNKIYSYAVILLVHLIKQQAEKRTTRSWDVSIDNSVREIKRTNKRRKSGGYYASKEELIETIDEAFEAAIRRAALEAFEGRHDSDELKQMIDVVQLKQAALNLIN